MLKQIQHILYEGHLNLVWNSLPVTIISSPLYLLIYKKRSEKLAHGKTISFLSFRTYNACLPCFCSHALCNITL